jgi:hypothetical protein
MLRLDLITLYRTQSPFIRIRLPVDVDPQPENPPISTDQTVIPGNAAIFNATVTPLLGPFNFPITLSATGLPSGATVTFSPQTATPGTTATLITMTVQTDVNQGLLHRKGPFRGGTVAITLLLVPFTRRLWQRPRKVKILHQMTLAITVLLCVVALASIAGCGAETGFFAESQQSYTNRVMGTAIGSNGYVLQQCTNVTLTLQ